MASFNYEVLEHIGVLSESPSGWKRELNIVSWNERPAKYDIRDWSPDHEKMGKGLTFTKEELDLLKVFIEEIKE
ncbi:MAG: PC4/YdbC family ssDNA-binding protein [Atopostipes sp.]|nr:PC4/YdbC family ssDNA-binding protein [Atopostipes sp.]